MGSLKNMEIEMKEMKELKRPKSHAERIKFNIELFIMMSTSGRLEDAANAINKARRLAIEWIDAENADPTEALYYLSKDDD